MIAKTTSDAGYEDDGFRDRKFRKSRGKMVRRTIYFGSRWDYNGD